MDVDIQGEGNCFCNPEIPSADLRDANDAPFSSVLETCLILPCEKFKEVQVRNQYCTLLKLDQE